MRGLTVALILALLAAPATAQPDPVCGPADAVARGLHQRYGEARVWSGEGDNGARLELWVSADTDTWTLIAAGKARRCLIKSGTGNSFAPAKSDDGA